ncbi:MAG TPA: hypothetical protein PK156_28420 [Polyangium sp.]|nr:hypothetical protein [Polyangium sp.]
MSNVRSTFILTCVAMIAIACSQCSSPDTHSRSSEPTSQSEKNDAGPDAEPWSDSSFADVLGDDVADLPIVEWFPIPGLEMCDGHSLGFGATWPTRIWTSCGPGCLTAPAVHLPDAILAGVSDSGAATIRGETYVRTTMYTSTSAYHELRRMSDDAVLYVLRFTKDCLVAGARG